MKYLEATAHGFRRNWRVVMACTALVGMALAPSCSGDRPSEIEPVEPGEFVEFPDTESDAEWRQWGGPGGDFKITAADLADSWPRGGPSVLWSRYLGEGYSAIAYDRGALLTIWRDGTEDVVTALRADDGATIWEYRYPVKIHEANMLDYGAGPNAMPLVLGDRVITLGFGGTLSCVELKTGRPLWSLDLVSDLGGQVLDFGNSASPIAYRESVIVLTGGSEQAVAALDPTDGSVIWRSRPGSVSYATPIVINLDGQDQLVYQSEDEIVGLDAQSGRHLWSHPCVNEYRDNVSTLIWGEDHLLWAATQTNGGTRVIRLERVESGTEVTEVWSSHKISIHFWSALRLDDHVYASIGGQGRIFACIDVRTGEIEWRKRGFEKVNLVHAGDKTVLLDADGELILARLNPDEITVLSQATISDGPNWTVPTLVGTTLYVRDKKTIRALDLGAGS